jgi:Fe-S-cluster containining protein
MELNEDIASINLDSKTHKIEHVTVHVRNMRFRCKRCATFCCKLGGPPLSLKDMERLRISGRNESEFLDDAHGILRNTPEGLCVYLRFNMRSGFFECTVYDCRPTLCRLYPFHFEKTGPESFMVRILPCRGVNRRYGELIDKEFIETHLIDALNDLSLKSY